jgi:hypothetical protein
MTNRNQFLAPVALTWRVFRFTSDEDPSKQTLVATLPTRDEAMDFARRHDSLGAHQVQNSDDGEVYNVSERA